MKIKLLKLLDFFRILDTDNKLSLTQLVIYVVTIKIATANDVSIAEATTLLIAMLSYGYKKHINKDKSKLNDENKKAIEDITAKVQQIADKTSGLAASIGLRNPLQK